MNIKNIKTWLMRPLYTYYATDWPERFGLQNGPTRLEVMIIFVILIAVAYFIVPEALKEI